MSQTLKEIAEQLERSDPAAIRLPLCFGGHRIDVLSNSEQLVERLSDYFQAFDEGESSREPDIVIRAHHRLPPELDLTFHEWSREPGKRTRKEAFCDLPDGRVVLKVRTGMQFLVGRDLRIAVGDCLTHPNQVVNFVNFQYTSHLMNQGLVLGHAAGVALGGKGLALAGLSGGGKSTLALHLISSGLDFVSNDRLLLGPGPGGTRIFGVPKHPRINPGTALANPDLRSILDDERREALEKLSRDELWQLEEKYDALIDLVYGPGRIRLAAPCKALLILAWNHRNAASARFRAVSLAERRDLLDAVMKSPGPFFLPERGSAPKGYEPPDPTGYLEALRDLPVYEATGGVDFAAGVDFCRELLEQDG